MVEAGAKGVMVGISGWATKRRRPKDPLTCGGCPPAPVPVQSQARRILWSSHCCASI